MYPYLFGVEFLSTFGILIAIGVISAVLLFKFLCNKFKISDKSYKFYSNTALFAIAGGFAGAFLLQQLYNFIDYVKTGTPFTWGGITFFGGLIGGALTFILITVFCKDPEIKNDFWRIANYAAPCIVLAHALGRFGCFFAGCCYGIRSDEHGLLFPGDHYKVIPTNLYEALFLLVLFGVMMLILFKFKKPDILMILYGFAYSVWRFIIEFYRGDDRGEFIPGLSPSQWQSILLLAIIIALTVVIYVFKKVPLKTATAFAAAPKDSQEDKPNNG